MLNDTARTQLDAAETALSRWLSGKQHSVRAANLGDVISEVAKWISDERVALGRRDTQGVVTDILLQEREDKVNIEVRIQSVGSEGYTSYKMIISHDDDLYFEG